MSNSSSPLAGPRRLILIHSGKYDYAELDLTQSFQLVGANGLGKTALIATLQYLYTDSQRDMRFGTHTTEESRKFYFRTDYSFVLFECETSLGMMMVGVRSQGAAGAYEMQRFVWKGGFRREDFVDPEGLPKRWDEIKLILGIKGLQLLPDAADLRRLLGAIDEHTVTSWGLIPLSDARDYGRFRQTFQRLLHLHNIRQDDLKELLADCAKLTSPQRQIDLEKEASRELATIERDRAEIARLEAARPKVAKVRSLHDDETVKRTIAHALARELLARYMGYSSVLTDEKTTLYALQEQCRLNLECLALEKRDLIAQRDAAVARRAQAEDHLLHIETNRTVFRDFVVEFEENAYALIDNEVTDLQGKLALAPPEAVEVLENELREKRELLAAQERAAARIQSLFITWLRARLPADRIGQLGALFNQRLLELEMDEQIVVADEAALLRRLDAALEYSDVRGYHDAAIEVVYPPGAVSAIGQLGNADGYRTRATRLRREIANLERAIEAKRHGVALTARLETRKQDRRLQAQRIEAYKAFRTDLSRETEYKATAAQSAASIATLDQQLVAIEESTKRDLDQRRKASLRLEALVEEERKVQIEARNMPVAGGNDPGPAPISDDAVRALPADLPSVFRLVRQKCTEANAASERLAESVGSLDQDFLTASFHYDASAPVEERLRQLEAQIASLEERNQAVQNRWRAVFSDARSGFSHMLKSLAAVKREIRKLNDELASIEFSSLENVRLVLTEDKHAVAEYERHAHDIATPSLFDSPADTDTRISQFHRLLEHRPRLVLNDLFALNCEVTRKDGLKNTYDDFDAVESTGTTIVLKVTLNLLVLRDLLLPGKARIPFYLDEVHALDRQNFTNIIQLSERLGFIGIFAAPTTAVGPRRFVHLVPDANGRLVVTEAHRKDILRDASAQEEVADG
ncbi:MAG: hypothetical protein IPL39_13520 [Opitutaceae bacterium]|nr:hypothetical protein [Opitutaceae bacterium]